MVDPIIDVGMTGGPSLRVHNASGTQDKPLLLNDDGKLILDGVIVGGGGMDMILSQLASASSSIDFGSADVTSAYDVHLLVGEGLVLATDRKDMHLLVSNDGGTTWEADASEYLYAGYSTRSSGAALTTVSAGATFIKLNGIDLSNVAAEGFGFNMYIKGAARAAAKTVFEGTVSGHDYLPRMNAGFMGGTHTTAEVVNGLRIIADSGNITSGRITLYGLKHA